MLGLSVRQYKQLTVQLLVQQHNNHQTQQFSVQPVSLLPQHQATQQSPNSTVQCTASVTPATKPSNTTITKHNSSSSTNEPLPRRPAGYSRNLLLAGNYRHSVCRWGQFLAVINTHNTILVSTPLPQSCEGENVSMRLTFPVGRVKGLQGVGLLM